jgi:hypothetical protein
MKPVIGDYYYLFEPSSFDAPDSVYEYLGISRSSNYYEVINVTSRKTYWLDVNEIKDLVKISPVMRELYEI